MNLYKEYKENTIKQQKEEEDKVRLGLPSETVIIYEENKVSKKLAYIGKVILLLIFLLLIGGVGVLTMICWFAFT